MEHIINCKFQEFFKGKENPENHLYLESFEWWQGMLKQFRKPLIVEEEIKEDHSNSIFIKNIDQRTFIPKKIASNTLLENIYSVIENKNTKYFYKIKNALHTLENYNLPSTISTLDVINPKDTINILLVGAGPIGLFTSIYLNKIYKKKNINILLVDNRIKEEGIRLPYTRVTTFNIELEELKFFFNKIFCLDFFHNITTDTSTHTYINILENLLYVYAYHHKIPMYFTKKLETFQEVKKYAMEKNFNYILDCTGERLNAKFTLNKELKWNQIKFKKEKVEVKFVGNNKYKLFVDGKEYKHTTVVLHLFDKDKKEYQIGNKFADINNLSDEKLINEYKNILMKTDDYLQLATHIHNFNLRNLYNNIIDSYKQLDIILRPKYVKITTFDTCSRHVKQAAKLLNKKLMYIGLGDTLGGSEYGIYFGLKHSMEFSRFICNLISIEKCLK